MAEINDIKGEIMISVIEKSRILFYFFCGGKEDI